MQSTGFHSSPVKTDMEMKFHEGKRSLEEEKMLQNRSKIGQAYQNAFNRNKDIYCGPRKSKFHSTCLRRMKMLRSRRHLRGLTQENLLKIV